MPGNTYPVMFTTSLLKKKIRKIATSCRCPPFKRTVHYFKALSYSKVPIPRSGFCCCFLKVFKTNVVFTGSLNEASSDYKCQVCSAPLLVQDLSKTAQHQDQVGFIVQVVFHDCRTYRTGLSPLEDRESVSLFHRLSLMICPVRIKQALRC